MRIFRQWAFYAIGVVLVALLSFWACTEWRLPVTFLCSGEVFLQDFDYVYHSGDLFDGFNVGVNKMFAIFLLFAVVLLPLLGLWRITARPFAGFRRGVYVALSAALSVFPMAAALVATVMVTRLTVDMGITQKRLVGIAVGIVCSAAFPLFLYLCCRRPGAKPDAVNPAIASRFQSGHHWRGVTDTGRWLPINPAGNPPALPEDSRSLTIPGIGRQDEIEGS